MDSRLNKFKREIGEEIAARVIQGILEFFTDQMVPAMPTVAHELKFTRTKKS